jgi:DNA-binding response OmpR family regulator
MPTADILIIEDDAKIARLIELELKCEGYHTRVISDGMEGLIAAREQPPDLVILDRLLPSMDGMEVCRRIRQRSDIPILMLTALSDFQERVDGLDAGANDYIVKPFNLDELLARIRAQLRSQRKPERPILAFADLEMDCSSHEVRRGNEIIHLTLREFELLQCLLRQPQQVVPRMRILETVWGWDFDGGDNALDVCMHGLRDKIDGTHQPKLLHTVRGVGFILRLP